MIALVADDQPEFVQSVYGLFKASGFTIEIVNDAVGAKNALQSRTFDLIVTDLQMPPGNWRA